MSRNKVRPGNRNRLFRPLGLAMAAGAGIATPALHDPKMGKPKSAESVESDANDA